MAKEFDWVGAWFPIMQEMGEDVEIPFGRFDPATGEVTWTRLSHQNYDGAGGLAKLLTGRGWKVGPLPARDEKPLGLFGKIGSFLRYLSLTKARTTPWRDYSHKERGRSAGIAWHVFSKTDTQRLERLARQHSSSLNSYLLWTLDRVVRKRGFSDPSHEAMWWIPVNMRGLVKRPDPWANHSSYFGVSLKPGDTAEAAHEKVRDNLQRGRHWGAWWGVNIGRFLGLEGMRKIMKGYETKQNLWAGTMTNMGAWPPDHSRAPATETPGAWLVSALVTSSHPLGAGLLTWDGQLTLTLQLHPVLTRDFGVTAAFFTDWLKELGAFPDTKSQHVRSPGVHTSL